MSIEFRFKPLAAWPRKETPSYDRKARPFQSTIGQTYTDLERELLAIGAKGLVYIEAGFEAKHIRRDGLPFADAPKPRIPGVVVYAPETKKGPLRFMCDDCREWVDNVRAIVLTMERLRLADRYGVTKDNEQYRGFNALPPPTEPSRQFKWPGDAALWAAGQDPESPPAALLLKGANHWDPVYRRLAMKFHPDRGGDPAGWQSLQEAKALIERGFAP